jgi:hypothetical protein
MKKSSLEIILILGTLILSSLACSLGGISFSGDKVTVDVTLSEDQVNAMIEKSSSNMVVDGDELLKSVSEVEFHDGFLRVFGTMLNSSGVEVNGSMDATFGVDGDALDVEIIAVDFEGVSMDDPRIAAANEEIERSLVESVTESNGEVKFLEADVSEDGLHLKIEAKTK